MNIKSCVKIALVSVSMIMFVGCAEDDEAKALGFNNVNEMKEIHARGWHTKVQYDEDRAKAAGFSSVAEMKNAEAAKKLEDEAKRKEQEFAVQRQKEAAERLSKYTPKAGDIGLNCTGKEKSYDRSDSSFMFIYSKVGDYGYLTKTSGVNDRKALFMVINQESVTDNSYEFSVIGIDQLQTLSMFNKKLNDPDARKAYGSWSININRKSLNLRLRHEGGFTGVEHLSYECNVLDDLIFAKEIFDREEEKRKSKSENKL